MLTHYERFFALRERMQAVVRASDCGYREGRINLTQHFPSPDAGCDDVTTLITMTFRQRHYGWSGETMEEALDHFQVAIEEWEAEYGC